MSIVVMIVVASSSYIFIQAVCGTVGVGHRLRGGWSRGVSGVRGGAFLENFRDVGWVRGVVSLYVIVLYRGVSAKFKFQVGLVVGVR